MFLEFYLSNNHVWHSIGSHFTIRRSGVILLRCNKMLGTITRRHIEQKPE